MSGRTAFPPSYHHASKTLSPQLAQEQLAAYLAQTPTTAYLHPDAILSQAGIQFPAQSGPDGGLALHHLRRIEAGIRGKNLIAESREELNALFAQPEVSELPEGDDSRIDNARKNKKTRRAERVDAWQDAQDPDDYAQEQTEMNEEFGAHIPSGTGAGDQVDSIPQIRSADKLDKQAKKAAKKERNKQRKLDAAAAAG